MPEPMTREELHELVWSQPMRTLAKSMGISDVALAKRCRAAGIPVPPRGWWARKEAGKPVKVTPLPSPPFVLANYFPALEVEAAGAWGGWRQVGVDEAFPGPPVFRRLAPVVEEIRAAVRPIKVPDGLTSPHVIVARLLRQDAGRKPSTGSSSYFFERNSRKFDTPIQQRRLRILSSLFNEFERLGCKISGSTHAGEKFSISVGGSWIYILFGIEGGAFPTGFHRGGAKRANREQLRFDLVEHDDRKPPLQSWREDEGPLERRVTELVRALLVRVEEHTRRSMVEHHRWAGQDHERRIVEARRAAEQADIARLAREKAQAAARVEALIGGADALERAARIRRYVAAVQGVYVEAGASSGVELERWTAWALGQADLIDPVVSGAFLADLEL